MSTENSKNLKRLEREETREESWKGNATVLKVRVGSETDLILLLFPFLSFDLVLLTSLRHWSSSR